MLTPRRIALLTGVLTSLGKTTVTVVVVAEPVDEPWLGDALAAVTGQSHQLLDIVVVPVGEVAVPSMGDPRVRRLRPARDAWAAVAAGAAAARGRYVTFVRGCDLVRPWGVGALARTAVDTGAVVVRGGLAQHGEADLWLERTQRGPVGGDLRLAGLLVRTTVFREALAAAGALGPGDDWLCSRLVAGLLPYRPATTPTQVYVWAHDHGTRPYGETPSVLPELDGCQERSAAMAAVLEEPFLGQWLRHQDDVVVPRLLADAERADEAQWARLRALASAAGVPGEVGARSLVWLAEQGRREEVAALAWELTTLGRDRRTRVAGDRLIVQWASLPETAVPEQVRTLEVGETPLLARWYRSVPVDASVRTGAFVAEVHVWIEHLDLAGTKPVLEAWSGSEALAVEWAPDPAAERFVWRRFQSGTNGVFRVRMEAPSEVRLRLVVDAISRETTLKVEGPLAAAGPVTDLGLEGDDLVAAGGSAALVDAGTVPAEGGQVPLRRAYPWGEQRVGSGWWRLDADPAPALADRLPVELLDARRRVVVSAARAGAEVLTELRVEPPFGEDEVGPYRQELLRAAYARASGESDRGVVYAESYAGRVASDTPQVVVAELLRRRPGLTVYWGVLDAGAQAPAGTTPVVLRSRAHYEVLTRASVVISNTDLDEWFVPRPGQLVVQTFHGYPAKAMGAMQWRARQWGPARIAANRRRTVETWGLIVTPNPAMTALYREQYDYHGPVVEAGYPRDDVLTSSEAPGIRARVRDLLGIGERTAVLYAPTWRDHLAVQPREAVRRDFLDIEAAARGLGPEYVVLVRGHRFHEAGGSGGAGSSGAGARVIDVTDYPEINDVILASDAAVLDYSSLRFDYALTGKPMVFLVPDLAEYAGDGRGFLYPFAISAPGPLVSKTGEVVAQLADVPGLREDWAERIADFNARFHPFQDGQATKRVADAIEARWK